MLYATRRINLKNLSHKDIQMLKKMCYLSKEVYNEALKNIKEHYDETGRFLFWQDNLKKIKDLPFYKEIGSCYSAIIKEAESNYKTYMTTIKNGKKYKLNNNWKKANPPDFKKHYFPLITENFKQRDGKIKLPVSRKYNKLHKIYFELPDDLKNIKIKKIIVRPKFYTMEEFEFLLIYDVNNNFIDLSKDEVLAIDLGVDNFATCSTSLGQAFIMDGRYIKSINQGFQKTYAKINRMKKKQNIKGYTKKERSLINKRFYRVEDYLNKSVNYIINHCIENKIGNIAVGYGLNFQQSPNIGHRNNQIFSQMPYSRFLTKLKFQCLKNGINFTIIDECYTSKASFYDNDPLPDYISGKKYDWSGKRRYRGLYIASDGRTINADLNGSLNIMRKCKLVRPSVIKSLQFRGVVQPKRIRVK